MNIPAKYRYHFKKRKPYLEHWYDTHFLNENGKLVPKMNAIQQAVDQWITKSLTYWQNFQPSPLIPEKHYTLHGAFYVPDSKSENASFFLITLLEQQSEVVIKTNWHCPITFDKVLLGYPEQNAIKLLYYNPDYSYPPADQADIARNFTPLPKSPAVRWEYMRPVLGNIKQADDAVMHLINEDISFALENPKIFANLVEENINSYTFYVEYQSTEKRVILGKFVPDHTATALKIQQGTSVGALHLPEAADTETWERALIETLASHPPHRPLCW